MADSFETCRDYRATIPLSLLKISELCDILSRLYESLNEKNRMCDVDKTHMKHGRRQQHVHLQYMTYCQQDLHETWLKTATHTVDKTHMKHGRRQHILSTRPTQSMVEDIHDI